MTKYQYEVTAKNAYLGKSKIFKGVTYSEAKQKARDQELKWKEKEEIERLKEVALKKTKSISEERESLQNILAYSLNINHKIDWNSLYLHNTYDTEFAFEEAPPKYEDFYNENTVPKEKKILEFIFSPIRTKRLAKEQEAKDAFRKVSHDYEFKLGAAQALHQKKKENFYSRQKKHNDDINSFKQSFENGDSNAIQRYAKTVLDNSLYPPCIKKIFSVEYEQNSKTVVIDYELTRPMDISDIVEYRFVATRKETTTRRMKKKEWNEFYDEIIVQFTLRNLYELASSIYTDHVSQIAFNGWIHDVDRATGKDFTSCIISVNVSKEQLLDMDLSRVIPKECFKKLKGVVAGSPSQLAPINPVFTVNTEDARFVETREILASVNSIPNLATMDWEDFEHLVAELFSQYFSVDDKNVKVTRCSKDGGVDAVIFDPDPVRGGKYIIQAKRYNNIIPVSAVRDLYGTMINEGAIKGILVTTSYYGSDSYKFAEDKPIKLISGSELIYLFSEFGYEVRIDLKSDGYN